MRDYLTKKELMKLSWRTIERMQRRRFKATVQYLLPHVPAYASIFAEHSTNLRKIRSVEDWHKQALPLFKKKYYIKSPQSFIVSPDAAQAFSAYKNYLGKIHKMEKLVLIMTALFKPKYARELTKTFYQPKMPFFSGGTESGSPTPVFITAHQKKLLEKIIEQITQVLQEMHDIKTDTTTGMNLFPYGPHLAWHATHLALDIVADLNLSTAAGGAIPTERLAVMAKTFKPKIIAGMHDYLKHRFFPALAKLEPKLPVRTLIMNGATKMTPADRENLAKAAHTTGIVQPTILDLYGASELKEDLLPECTPNSGFHHIAPLSTIIRTIKAKRTDDNFITAWEFTKPEEGGHAAIWTIDGAGTLFEGYVLGDHYECTSRDTCQHCGLRVERIYNVNRIKDLQAQKKLTGIVEQKIKGAKINLTALRDELLKQNFVKEAQLIVDKNFRGLAIRFASTLPPKKAIIAAKKALAGLEITPVLECVPLEELLQKGRKFEAVIIGK